MAIVHPSILALGYSEAGQFLRRPDINIRALISIHGNNEPALETRAPLQVSFQRLRCDHK